MDVINNFIEMAELLYPKGYNSGTVELLKYTLSDPIILNGYIPAAKNEVNIMTLHKQKDLNLISYSIWICINILYPMKEAQIVRLNS